MAEEALELHDEGMIEHGEEIPAPSTLDQIMRAPEHRDGVAILDMFKNEEPKGLSGSPVPVSWPEQRHRSWIGSRRAYPLCDEVAKADMHAIPPVNCRKSVVEPALMNDRQGLTAAVFSPIDQPMLLGDTAKPEPLQLVWQWLRLADAFKRMPQSILEQLVDAGDHLGIAILPINVLPPGLCSPTSR